MRMRIPFIVIIFFLIGITGSCVVAITYEQNPGQFLVITQPSNNETVFAEMRDFYVYGVFTEPLQKPGNIRIELFKGDDTSGERMRLIESHVDVTNGTTPESAIEMNYTDGLDWGNKMVPDLVKEPGGLFNPSNKVVVTNDYYLGLVLGGVTKGVDTTYTDKDGRPLKDLTAGNYTIRVTGLSGNLTGNVAEKTLTFGLTNSSLSTDRPPINLKNRFEYSWARNLRIYRDWFPGYFRFPGYGDRGYSVPKRFNPNNGIEIVNDLNGTLIDKPAIANNTMIQYNINDRSTTYAVEIAAMVRYGLEDSRDSTFTYYDIGEPFLAYTDASTGRLMNISGKLAPFPQESRLVLTRAEMYRNSSNDSENLYDPYDTSTPRRVDIVFNDGLLLNLGEDLVVYGVTKPIRSTVTETQIPYRFMIDNRIAGVSYTITDAQGSVISRTNRDVNLSRLFVSGSTQQFNSLFEFGHSFKGLKEPGMYRFQLVGTDEQGQPVPGTAQTFSVTVLPLAWDQATTAGEVLTWLHYRFYPMPAAMAIPV